MYGFLQRRLASKVRDFLRSHYDLELPNIVIEQPPRVELGEYALPLAFELAKKLRKPPRKIAEEIVSGIGPIEGFEKLELAGAGYINARVDRGMLARALAEGRGLETEAQAGKILVEHTSINPNKAAHIGHLRNAILGDTFVRLLRAAGNTVDIQNYIDNTGVQVADVVVGFVHLEKKSKKDVEGLIAAPKPRFDYYCWDLYARVSQWYERDKKNLEARGKALHAIEQGGNELADMAELISTAIIKLHLETMERLEIEYDFLPRESEILRLHFWEAAFQKLKEHGVLYYETQGKNAGCWVMKRAGRGAGGIEPKELQIDTFATPGELEANSVVRVTHLPTGIVVTCDEEKSQAKNREKALQLLQARVAEAEREKLDEDTKVIVRSNGTVGYVGKDIAYHLWKFGLLGRDFGYRRFYRYPNGHQCWVSSDYEHNEPEHPHFGDVSAIYNVIDARQAEAQNTVVEALRGMGSSEQAEHYTHFSYEMVALTPRCAQELGYTLSEDEWGKAYIEVSGRRGFGVKADDLMDALIASARKEVDTRHSDLSGEERQSIANQIAMGALRYFMLKFTKNSVIAFDFKDALSFEGDTGPYAQYAVVRASNIFRKAGVEPEQVKAEEIDFARHLAGEAGNEIWELWLAAARTSHVVEQCIATTEPAYAARH
ncbi:MAG TPA: arginine--tRNA ligase, partial [Terriglobales bacterium]|nr:arginine--tRNA ligase [Terriglobales bacterium]